MNKEQSITDILQMLKTSVNENGESPDETFTSVEQPSLSCEELKQQLRQQFASDDVPDSESESFSYAIDPSLFEIEEELEDEPLVDEEGMEGAEEALDMDDIIGEEISADPNVDYNERSEEVEIFGGSQLNLF